MLCKIISSQGPSGQKTYQTGQEMHKLLHDGDSCCKLTDAINKESSAHTIYVLLDDYLKSEVDAKQQDFQSKLHTTEKAINMLVNYIKSSANTLPNKDDVLYKIFGAAAKRFIIMGDDKAITSFIMSGGLDSIIEKFPEDELRSILTGNTPTMPSNILEKLFDRDTSNSARYKPRPPLSIETYQKLCGAIKDISPQDSTHDYIKYIDMNDFFGKLTLDSLSKLLGIDDLPKHTKATDGHKGLRDCVMRTTCLVKKMNQTKSITLKQQRMFVDILTKISYRNLDKLCKGGYNEELSIEALPLLFPNGIFGMDNHPKIKDQTLCFTKPKDTIL